MTAEGEASHVGEIEIRSHEHALFTHSEGKHIVIGSAPATGVANMDCIVSDRPQRDRQGAWQILIDQKSGHLLADRADALVRDQVRGIRKCG